MKQVVLLASMVLFCACAQNKVEKAAGITFSMYPAVEGEAGNKKCKDFLGRCMLLQTDTPLFQLTEFEFKALPKTSSDKHNQIELFFDPKQSAAFETIPGKYIGEEKRLAIVYESKILHAPKLKTKIMAQSLVIDFCNEHVYKIVLTSLRGKTPPDYKFNDDKFWNMCDIASEE